MYVCMYICMYIYVCMCVCKESLENQSSSITIEGRKINNLRFADDIYLIAGSESWLQFLTDSLEKNSTSYGMEISHEKS